MSDYLDANLRALEWRTGHALRLGSPILPPDRWRDESSADALDRLLAATGGRPPSVVFVVGSGGGAVLDAVEGEYPEAEVIVVEPDPGAAERMLTRRDWTGWIATGRFTFVTGADLSSAGRWRPDPFPSGPLPVLVLPQLADDLPEEAERARQLVHQIVEDARANDLARRAHSGRYLLHTLANLPAIAREGDVASLSGCFPRLPAIVVGAGPSLDDGLTELAAVADRVIVVACAAAARPLMLAGIAPHFIVAVDPSESNAAHLSGLPEPRKSWLVAEGSLFHTAFDAFDRRTFVFNVSDHHPWPWLASLGIRRGRLDTWGSGASSALDFALRLGCAPVLFAGMDFAFTGGRPYCRGTTFEAQWAAAMTAGQTFQALCQQMIGRWPLTLEPDVEGQLVRTAPHLVSFRNWICQRIEATPRVRFKQVTPGGILHHPCIEQASVADALLGSRVANRGDVDEQIRRAHRASSGMTPALFEGIDRLLSGDAPAGDPRDAWTSFVGGRLPRTAFAAALQSHEYDAWRAAGARRSMVKSR